MPPARRQSLLLQVEFEQLAMKIGGAKPARTDYGLDALINLKTVFFSGN